MPKRARGDPIEYVRNVRLRAIRQFERFLTWLERLLRDHAPFDLARLLHYEYTRYQYRVRWRTPALREYLASPFY